MISILSIGSYRPSNKLDKELTGSDAGPPVYSTLDINYLNDTKNKDISAAIKNTVISTTELGVQAALLAIKKAGISKEQVGLIIADCATPVEIIPGESQRIACALGLKVPAFDIVSGSTAMITFLQSLMGWKKEKLPEYVLCISVNSPTQRVDYSAGDERSFFSDGAGAMIVSSLHKGKLILKECENFSNNLLSGALQINLYGHIKIDLKTAAENYLSCRQSLNHYISSSSLSPKIISVSYPFSRNSAADSRHEIGNSLGAGIFFELDADWDNLTNGDTIVLFASSLEAQGGGFSLMKVES